jgi:hypothetical protein
MASAISAPAPRRSLRLRFTDLPVVAERIDHTTDEPTILCTHRPTLTDPTVVTMYALMNGLRRFRCLTQEFRCKGF